MDFRHAQGREIALSGRLKKKSEDTWSIRAESQIGETYTIIVNNNQETCNCADFVINRRTCKHIYAVKIIQSETPSTLIDNPELEIGQHRQTYSQDWSKYNMAQTNEKNNFLRLLAGFCKDISSEETRGRGRPPIPLADAVYLACYKQYETLSARRFMCDVNSVHDMGFISCAPHFNSILNKLNDDDVTQALFDLIEFTSIPLRGFERVFAADSSGFGNSMFDRWIVIKPSGKTGVKKKKVQKRKTWTKVHLMCGVDTHIVTAVVIKDQHASDTTQLPELVTMTAKNFELKEVCADRIYGSKKNYEVIGKHGAVPYIAFKADAVADGRGRTGEFKLGRELWARMHHEMEFYTEEYLAHYHKRSNVELVFSMVKRKFGHFQRCKTDTGRLNEALAKIVCHNICCLNSAIFELGLDLDHILAPRLRRVGVPQASRLEAVE